MPRARPLPIIGSALAAAGLCAVVFRPVAGHGFLNYDDGAILELAARGLGPAALRGFFAAPFFCNYSPVAWIAMNLVAAVAGPAPAAYHLASLVLHAANAALVFVLALELLGGAGARPSGGGARPSGAGEPELGGALVAALAFALHPLRVESVAWAFELRDPLCGLFALACLLAWTRERRGVALALFALALLAKPAALPLPAGLAALELGRGRRPAWRALVPFFALAAVLAAVAAAAQSSCGAVTGLARLPAGERALRALEGLVFYTGKTLWPSGLTLYEWHRRPLAEGVAVGLAATAGLLVLAAARRDRRAPILAALAWQTVFVAPTLGVVLGHQPFADRYTYLAGLGWAALAGAAWRELARARRAVASLAAAAVLAAMAAATRVQLASWEDSASLWSRVLNRDPESWVARPNLAQAMLASGRRDLAQALLEDQLRVYPGDEETRRNLEAVRRGAAAR